MQFLVNVNLSGSQLLFQEEKEEEFWNLQGPFFWNVLSIVSILAARSGLQQMSWWQSNSHVCAGADVQDVRNIKRKLKIIAKPHQWKEKISEAVVKKTTEEMQQLSCASILAGRLQAEVLFKEQIN